MGAVGGESGAETLSRGRLMRQKIIYCSTCRANTSHRRARHHSGETLWKCDFCPSFHPGIFASPKKDTISKRKKNPLPHRYTQELLEGAELYEDFTGKKATQAVRLDKPKVPGVMLRIGYVDGIMYSTVRDGKHERFIHEFKKNSRPLFAVSHDGKSLHMLGGAYDFTERGIVDKRS